MRSPLLSLFASALLAAGLSSSTALAHEFLVLPEKWNSYQAGQELPVSIYSTHVFAKGEELEPAEVVKLSFLGKDVPLEASKARLTYDGKITLPGGGAAILTGTRLPLLWSKTPSGGKDGGRDVNKDATLVTSYEKFAKVLLPVDGKTAGFDTVVGHRLEIVPVDDPLAAKVGDELRFKVLLDGKPAAFDRVKAVYDGFSDIPDSWAFEAAQYAHGEARVKITHPGMWILRVSQDLNEKSPKFDAVNLKAVLVFQVNE